MAVKFLQQRRIQELNHAYERTRSKDVTRIRQGIKSYFHNSIKPYGKREVIKGGV